MDLTDIVERSLSGVEDKLLAIEREVIREETKKQKSKWTNLYTRLRVLANLTRRLIFFKYSLS